MKKLRIGILSTANIARTNWTSIALSRNCVVAAVASRDVERSRKFISECQRQSPLGYEPMALGSYEELLKSPEVDAVYVPLPTALRKEYVIRAANAGKHVLSEKPCGTNAKNLEAMIAACKKNRVQFMDGVMFMHHPRLAQIRKVLDDGKTLGPIRRIASHFSFCGGGNFHQKNIRVNSELEPLGCLGDLGWYNIRIALWAMNWQMPRQVEGRIISSPKKNPGMPIEFSGELFFDGGVSSNFYCSFVTLFHQYVDISGGNGYLRIPDFVRTVEGRDTGYEVNHRAVKSPCAWDMQQVYMVENFAKQIFSGKLNPDWPMWSLKTQQVTDACFKSALGKLK
jgi:predicted dehydrogenase